VAAGSRARLMLFCVALSVTAADCSHAFRNKDPLTARLASHCGVSSTRFQYYGELPTFAPAYIREWVSDDGNYLIDLYKSAVEPEQPYFVSCNGGGEQPISIPVSEEPKK
jgi:hypothetical protein